jgi:hypothetical protein
MAFQLLRAETRRRIRTAAAPDHQRPLYGHRVSRMPALDEHLEIRARRRQRKRDQHHDWRIPYLFTIEPIKSKKEDQNERLRLAFGMARDRASASKFWEDSDESSLEDRLTEVLVEMLLSAEASYRNGLVRNREWIIERKAEAEAEIKRRKEEAERKARELQEKLARERIGRLLSQAKALDRANQIRTYVESARLRAPEIPIAQADFDKWAMWARQEADRIDPVKNGTIARAIEEHSVD